MQVWTGLVPNEFVGYHPMKAYNRNSLKRNGKYPYLEPWDLQRFDTCRLERGFQLVLRAIR